MIAKELLSGPCKKSQTEDFCMTSAREYPVSSQKPSLQKMIGTDSTWALAMMNFRSARRRLDKISVQVGDTTGSLIFHKIAELLPAFIFQWKTSYCWKDILGRLLWTKLDLRKSKRTEKFNKRISTWLEREKSSVITQTKVTNRNLFVAFISSSWCLILLYEASLITHGLLLLNSSSFSSSSITFVHVCPSVILLLLLIFISSLYG